MYVIPCIELNVVAIALCLMVHSLQSPVEKSLIFGTRHFNRMLGFTILILLLNSIAWIIEGYYPGKGAHIHMLLMTAFFLCQTILSMELIKYCLSICNIKPKLWIRIVATVPLLITFILLTVNLIHPFAYHIDQNVYKRMHLFPLIVICPLIYILTSVTICAARYFRSSAYEREISLKLLFFTLIILASAALSAVIYGFTPWPIIALSLVYLHMNVHSKYTKELGMLAYKDSLTGVQNATAHSFMMHELDGRIRSGNAAFAIIVADVNDLKLVNDAYGHKAGDQLLICAARLICEIFAHSPVQRIGGDEFAIILEGADYENRDVLLRRLQREIAYTTFPAGNRERTISLAFGMAEYDSHVHRSSADVFQAADRIMYIDKDNCKQHKR